MPEEIALTDDGSMSDALATALADAMLPNEEFSVGEYLLGKAWLDYSRLSTKAMSIEDMNTVCTALVTLAGAALRLRKGVLAALNGVTTHAQS